MRQPSPIAMHQILPGVRLEGVFNALCFNGLAGFIDTFDALC